MLIFIVLAMVSYVLTRTDRTSVSKHPVPTTAPASVITSPLKPLVPGAPKNVTFIYSGPLVVLPEKLPTYSLSFLPLKDLENMAVEFAKTLGYSQQPENKTRPNGYIKLWTDEKGAFSFINNGEQHSFSIERYSSSPPLTFPSSPVLTLLRSIYPYDNIDNFSLLQAPAQSFEGMVFLDGRPKQLTRQLYAYTPDGKHPLLLVNYSKTVLSGVFDEKGSVRAFAFHIIPQLQKSGAVSIKSIDEIFSALAEQKGILISSQKNDEWGSVINYSRVNITEIELAYTSDKHAGTAYPVFLLSGNIDGETNTTIQYLLPAAR